MFENIFNIILRRTFHQHFLLLQIQQKLILRVISDKGKNTEFHIEKDKNRSPFSPSRSSHLLNRASLNLNPKQTFARIARKFDSLEKQR